MPHKSKPTHSKKTSSVSPQSQEEEMSKDLTQYVTTAQAAELLGVRQTSIAHLIYNNKIRGTKLGSSWLLYRPSIEQYMKTKAPGGRPRSGTPQLQDAQ